jgi:membrane fusion protein (multidrug efflux system)
MNPIVFALRRPISTTMLVAALVSGGVLASNPMGLDALRSFNAPQIYASVDSVGMRAKQMVDSVGMRAKQMKDYVVGQYESYFHKHNEEGVHEGERKIVVTSPKAMDVTITQPYVCQIRSQRHIEVQALDSGYLEEIAVREGQAVKKGDVMFRILPILYKAKADAEVAEALLAEREYNNTKKLFEQGAIVSQNEVLLFAAKRDRAKAKAELAKAELNFTDIRAAFDGIVDRQRQQLGSFLKEGEVLTTLSDNSKMWVYFNVPEKQYLEYKAAQKQHEAEDKIELLLANHDKFPESCVLLTIEAQFNNETGNIAFRADFPNPDGLLRHGQTGTILIHQTLKNAVVIPQRATFELLDKRYVWVVGEDDVAHQRLITISHELEDIFVINNGTDVKQANVTSGPVSSDNSEHGDQNAKPAILDVKDKIVLEGVRQVEEGRKVEYEFRKPEEALNKQKFHAE